MRYGILGQGFGLYGYLPAIVDLTPLSIVTLARYQDTLRSRPELAAFESLITFVENRAEVLARCDTLVVAMRPQDQETLIEEILACGWRGTIILEKPVTRTPAHAAALIERLIAADLMFSVGFSLMETSWARELLRLCAVTLPGSLEFNWRFMAQHYKHDTPTWKRRVEDGGGCLRFYGIHLIAILARLAEWTPQTCSALDVDGEDAACQFTLLSGNSCATVICNSRWEGAPRFEVTARESGKVLLSRSLTDPFTETPELPMQYPAQDRRVQYVNHILENAQGANPSSGVDYLRHIYLWRDLEHLRQTVLRRGPLLDKDMLENRKETA